MKAKTAVSKMTLKEIVDAEGANAKVKEVCGICDHFGQSPREARMAPTKGMCHDYHWVTTKRSTCIWALSRWTPIGGRKRREKP